MKFRSGRRTNSKSQSENHPELPKERCDQENEVVLHSSVSNSASSFKRVGSALGKSGGEIRREPLVKRELNNCGESESDGYVEIKPSEPAQVQVKVEVIEELPPPRVKQEHQELRQNEQEIPSHAFTADEIREVLAESDLNSVETQVVNPTYSTAIEGVETTEDDSDKENRKSPLRKKLKRESGRRKDSDPKGNQRSSKKRRVSFDASDADESSVPNESTERRRRQRSAPKASETPVRSRKVKDEDDAAAAPNGLEAPTSTNASDQCSTLVEPSVKVTKEESLADLEAKAKDSEPIPEPPRTEEDRREVDEDSEVLEGTLVLWKGSPYEPVFKKKTSKPGRFYIVNCGETKASVSSTATSSLSNSSYTKPAEVPTTVAPGCSCCASGCQYGNHGVITGETSKRVSRRRPKGPKKVQLVTKEEHHKILSSYIEDKKYEPDFKVDSLFANQVDPSQQSQGNSSGGESGSRRTRLQNRMGGKQAGKQQVQKHQGPPDQPMGEEDDQVVSFTVRGNPEVVDDVAGYEMVDSNALLQKNGEQNPEFGIQIGQDEYMGMDQRQKRPYRMRKVPNKESQGEITCDPSGKPRCTYTDLIEKALQQSSGGLTVSEIYTWISTNYPYFQANDDRWKNSVRHNLSINPYFKKGDKARNGAGHLWVISEDGKGIRPPIRRKSGSDSILDAICIENGEIIPIRNETDRAISVILSEYAMASMQHQNSNHQEEESPVTYIQIPNDIAIGTGEESSGQVICYEDLPDGSYTMVDVQEPHGQENQMYALSDFSDGNVIIVNPDESNKENMNGQMMEDMVISDFSVLSHEGGMITSGRLSAPPTDNSGIFATNYAKRERALSRSSSLPIESAVEPQEVLLDSSASGMNESETSRPELTMLSTVSTVGGADAMDAIGIVTGSQDPTQVIEIMGDHLFDAKELGMVYEYDNQGDPLFL